MLWDLNTPLLKLATPRSVYNNAAIRRTSSLPVNVIESHVLPNLSFDTILRLKCVSKEWNKFFSSTCLHFLEGEQQNHQTISIALFKKYPQTLRSIEIVEQNNSLERVAVEATAFSQKMNVDLYGSRCGLLCFVLATCVRWHFTVGNPQPESGSYSPPQFIHQLRSMRFV